ncbi:hypothetical protein KLAF111653_24020 [Klebsiella africana]|uniref:Uncharacterized protein n=1 Tax=Klebsiella africana TaxID=2489010 RepID=A0A8B6J0L5_9ENTR|nr:hypothetical protein [Klebsiella africana]UDD38272.1 hypothetical protein LGL98_13570 [Klebsiella africana]VGQ13560.1 hypothetical protein SB5857_04773 [Klebsiella africana]
MNTAKIPHVSLTTKDGYVFRKRYQTGTLYLALRTKEAAIASQRGAAVSIRYLELEPLNLPYEAVYLSLKQYRDEVIRQEQIAMLKRVANFHISSFSYCSSYFIATFPQQQSSIAIIIKFIFQGI